jgi:hypothetical protein
MKTWMGGLNESGLRGVDMPQSVIVASTVITTDRPRRAKLPFERLALGSYALLLTECNPFLARAWFWMALAYVLKLLLGLAAIGPAVSRHADAVVIVFCSVPFLVAWHRHVLLLDRSRGLFRFGRREARFLALELIMTTVLSLPAWFSESYGWTLRASAPVYVFVLAFLVITVALALLGARLSVLFPAIAIDAPQFNAKHAWALTRGSTLRLFIGFVLIAIPLIPFGWVLGWSKLLVTMHVGGFSLLLMPLIDVVFTFVYLGVLATFASVSFNWLVQPGNEPA